MTKNRETTLKYPLFLCFYPFLCSPYKCLSCTYVPYLRLRIQINRKAGVALLDLRS